MDEPTATIASVRLRLSGRQISRIKELFLSEPLAGKAIIGVCGSTAAQGALGTDFIAAVHAVSETLIEVNQEPPDETLDWLAKKQKRQPLLPIIFHHGGQEGNSQAILFLENLVTRSGRQGLIVNIESTGSMSGFIVRDGEIRPVDTILIAGSDIIIWSRNTAHSTGENDLTLRLEQSFGSKTSRMLSSLRVGVVGVSGTGSPVAEMLYRLGVAEITLVDDDRIEEKNLGRIYNSSVRDAEEKRLKVDVIGDAFSRNGLPPRIRKIAKKTYDSEVIKQLAQCDIIFGCMDTHAGRLLLNKLCTFYMIPYFDLGVKLEADGNGSVSTVCGVIHYLQPDGSSLLSRKAIYLATIEAEDLRRTDPDRYKQLKQEKYIKGAQEDRPAVITVNTMIASMAMNDFLARLHPYRNNPNSEVGSIYLNLREPRFMTEVDGEPDEGMSRWVGLGDITPILAMPSLA